MHVSILAALSSHGVEVVMTTDGATDAEVCRVYVAQVLRPTLRLGDIVIMDRQRTHKAAGIQDTIEQLGAPIWYLPPYSPDLSPNERCWSKLKTSLRKAEACTREALERAIAEALALPTEADASGGFTHGGYALQ